MSLWNVMQVGPPLMMHVVEMYMIVAVVLVTPTLGLTQTCLQYCIFSPEKSSSIPPGCDCSHSTTTKHMAVLPETEDSGIYYDTEKQNYSQFTSSGELTLHMLGINSMFKSKLNTYKRTKKEVITANTSELYTEQDSSYENYGEPSNKYKRGDAYLPNAVDETKDPPLNLYLDIDIASEKENRPRLEELKNMFENFQTAEKNLSECIDLHIYIFSKYIDTINKTKTNWGRKGHHDNSSSFQQLTEIESKCDQPTSIIKQSIYQIKQVLSREDTTSEITQGDQERIDTGDSTEQIDAQSPTNQFGIANAVTRDIMNLNGMVTDPTDDSYISGTEAVDVQFQLNHSEYDDYNLFYNHLPDKKKEDITSTSAVYEESTVYHKINVKADPIGYDDDLGTTAAMDRIVVSETDMIIPRINTKELANGTLLSVVDGFEKVPNSDFITDSTMSTPSNNESNSNPDVHKSNIDEKVQSNVVNIHGNLYFSFGEKQIPARFIQQTHGELAVAIDGFSMCGQMLEQNSSSFMNSLCKCIIHKNCT